MTLNVKVALINQKQNYKTKIISLKMNTNTLKELLTKELLIESELLLLKSSLTSILRQQNHLQCLQMANQWNGGFRRDQNCLDKYNSRTADQLIYSQCCQRIFPSIRPCLHVTRSLFRAFTLQIWSETK